MDRAALDELYDYTDFTWKSYENTVRQLPADAFTRQLDGAGWLSLRDVLFHLAVAWDEWLREQVGADDPLDAKLEDITGWDELRAHRKKIRGWIRRIIDETSDAELSRRQPEPKYGLSYEVSKAEMLTHMLLHERGHHGDVSTTLSRLGVEPAGSDYLVYLYFKQRRTVS
jgi:uncharacterized damage-inducible protein DinB